MAVRIVYAAANVAGGLGWSGRYTRNITRRPATGIIFEYKSPASLLTDTRKPILGVNKMIEKNDKIVLLITFFFAIIVTFTTYLIARTTGSDDAVFFCGLVFFSVTIASLASPNKNILNGCSRLWLFDWIGIAAVPVLISFFDETANFLMRILMGVSFALFFLAVAIIARRDKSGKSLATKGSSE